MPAAKKSFWKERRVMITGGDGFLGSHLVARVRARGCREIFIPAYPSFDFVRMEDIERALAQARPDIVIHLAAKVASIEENRKKPGEFFYDNLMMGCQLMEACRRHKVRKFVALGSINCYPKHAPVPFKEENLWDGYPDEVSAYYGMAKKMLLVQSQAYRSQYGFNSIFLMPVNLYGPGDKFSHGTAHVIAATIQKCCEAVAKKRRSISAWGSGTQTREFLFVGDCAEAIVKATERYDSSEPVNLGSGKEISIKELVGMIARLCGFKGEIRWDTAKPDGQPRRCVDTTKAFKEFGFKAHTPLDKGLAETISWYRARLGANP